MVDLGGDVKLLNVACSFFLILDVIKVNCFYGEDKIFLIIGYFRVFLRNF